MTASIAIRAEALFASLLQESTASSPAQVRAAVVDALLRHGVTGCATVVAAEFGDHPDLAIRRMRWAVKAVRSAYARQQRR
ncbi:hypothetical protein [Phytohabitans suffuscus]|nr:hypothetical protein [Phytohabitans suffuscus]